MFEVVYAKSEVTFKGRGGANDGAPLKVGGISACAGERASYVRDYHGPSTEEGQEQAAMYDADREHTAGC